jgi:hypothetical protein
MFTQKALPDSTHAPSMNLVYVIPFKSYYIAYQLYSYCISDLINMYEHAYSLFTIKFRNTSVPGPLLSKLPDEDPGLASVVSGNGRIVYSRRLLYAYVRPVTYVEKGAWQPMHPKKEDASQ